MYYRSRFGHPSKTQCANSSVNIPIYVPFGRPNAAVGPKTSIRSFGGKFCPQKRCLTLPSRGHCPARRTSLRGYYHVSVVIGFSNDYAPSNCFNCGNAYPWTVMHLDEA
ncbi:DUF2321 domain-containing protein [Methylocaldum szegediense]|uniref:DUF2321 domain-containing protein n=1 Tax=Methylocaldum szegediense TaxID=73780 RepID=UPI0037C57F4B